MKLLSSWEAAPTMESVILVDQFLFIKPKPYAISLVISSFNFKSTPTYTIPLLEGSAAITPLFNGLARNDHCDISLCMVIIYYHHFCACLW